MPIPPQFVKHAKGKKPDNAAEDAADGGADDSQETPAKKGHSMKGPKRDSKDPKGAPFDAIPSGPMKGKNPNVFQHKGKKSGSNSKRDALIAQLRGGK